jgi:NAD(P)H-dependent FMN reductase
MADAPRILVFAGSARKASFNKKLAKAAAAAAEKAGGAVTFIDLADYPMPIYDGDLEDAEGLPENAHKLKKLFFDHDALIIACPEYNGSITPLLKNTIDWVSRKADADEGPLACYQDKVGLIVSASPGALGGLRALRHLRIVLEGINVLVLPDQKAVPKAHEAFDDAGNVTDEKLAQALEKMTAKLVTVTQKLTS